MTLSEEVGLQSGKERERERERERHSVTASTKSSELCVWYLGVIKVKCTLI